MAQGEGQYQGVTEERWGYFFLRVKPVAGLLSKVGRASESLKLGVKAFKLWSECGAFLPFLQQHPAAGREGW